MEIETWAHRSLHFCEILKYCDVLVRVLMSWSYRNSFRIFLRLKLVDCTNSMVTARRNTYNGDHCKQRRSFDELRGNHPVLSFLGCANFHHRSCQAKDKRQFDSKGRSEIISASKVCIQINGTCTKTSEVATSVLRVEDRTTTVSPSLLKVLWPGGYSINYSKLDWPLQILIRESEDFTEVDMMVPSVPPRCQSRVNFSAVTNVQKSLWDQDTTTWMKF